jgi:glycosyltransferase involved in cell wall biosynthesis
MRVLQVHNFYRQSGGEDAVVEAERCLLEAHGWQVDLFRADNVDIRGIAGAVAAAWNTAYSRRWKNRLEERLAAFKPDLVHVHNVFPLLSPSIFDACVEAGIASVMTLHNYRLVSPNAMLMHQGRLDEHSVRGSAYRCVLHGCYRGSRLQTLVVAHMIETHRRRRTWQTKVDRFIALTEFAKRKFVEGGLPGDRIVVKPNFVQDDGDANASSREAGARALFVGRLSHEKGLRTLLKAWETLAIPLRIAGDGPLLEETLRPRPGSIEVLGHLSGPDVRRQMQEAAFLVMPSEWYEGFPMVLVEAYSQGLPVVASRIGALAELVADGDTGLHFAPGDAADLRAKAQWMAAHPEECRSMGERARRLFEQRYRGEANFSLLREIYRQALDDPCPARRKSP